MLSEYHDLLEKRRLERKRGHNPVPELPPFVPLPRDELAQLTPSSPASFDYEPYFAREPITLSRRSPSVYSRQSSSPAPATSRNMITTPPPLASSTETALEQNQRTSPQRPSYLSQLAPFSVTPRKRLFAETTMIAVEQVSITEQDEDEMHRPKRALSPSTPRETEQGEYPERHPVPASMPETEHVNNSNQDVDMVNANTHNQIPNDEQPLSPVVEENDMTEDLSIHELSIHEESIQEDHVRNTPPAAVSTQESSQRDPQANGERDPQASSDRDHHTSVLDNPQEPVAKESPQEQNTSQPQTTRDDSQETNEPQQQQQQMMMPGDKIEESTKAQDAVPGSVELQEPVVQENVEKSTENAYRTTVEEEVEGSQHEAGEIIAAKVTDQTIIQDHASEAANPVNPATEGNPIKYGFDDDNIDYGGYEDNIHQEQEQVAKPADSMSQAEEDASSDVVRDLRAMATANTVNLRKIRRLSNLHIQTISNLALDSTKDARDTTADAHEKSIIEDYYYTINDDLKKCHKQYLQYQQCASANRRLKAYHRKKDLQFLNVIKEEGALKRRIQDLRQEMDQLEATQHTWTRIEDLFHDIHQIATVTKQA